MTGILRRLPPAVLGFAGTALVLAGVAVVLNWQAIGRSIGPSCTLGVTGTAAKLTVNGWGASGVCDSVSAAGIYHYSGPVPNEPVICQYTVQGARATVRDAGVLKLVGNLLCHDLAQQAGH